MELAPRLGLCRRIVDLVSSGATLSANGLVEIEKISEISARLAVNRRLKQTQRLLICGLIDLKRFRMTKRLRAETLTSTTLLKYFWERKTSLSDATRVSADIIKKVRKNGDKALIKLTKKFDGLDLTTKDLVVDLNEIDEATSKFRPII